MARDLYGLEASGLPPELVAALAGNRQSDQIAQAMLAQSMRPVENMGGPGANLSWTQGAAKMLEAYLGRKGMNAANDARTQIGQQATSGRQAAMEAYQKRAMGAPGVTPLTPNDDEGNAMPSAPSVAGDPRAAILEARMSPYLQNAKFLDSAEQNLHRKDMLDDAQAARSETLKATLAAASEREKEKIAAAADRQREKLDADKRMRECIVANRPAPQPQAPTMTTVVDPSNPKQMLAVDAKTYKGGGVGSPGVLGVAGKEPAAAKQAETVDAGRSTVSELVGELRGHYDSLKAAGAITDTKQGGMKNAVAGVANTPPAQFVQNLVGGKSQSVRNSIEMTRPLLLNAIRSATGMSARQMDSNRELQLYLSAATDPAKGYEANSRALDMLDKLYGLSGKADSGPPAGIGPELWKAMTPEEKALWKK